VHKFRVLLFPLFGALASCGGGGDSGGGNGGGNGGFPPSSTTWKAGVFQPSGTFDAKCAVPRPGTADRLGTVTDQNNWLRSWTNELYLWYGEVTDRDPSLYTTDAYFNLLKTAAKTASGADKDKFHFVYPTDVWEALSQGGVEAGYGAEFAILASLPPRRIVVAYTDPNTTAATNLQRGDEILQVDGADAVNGAGATALNAGLFPDSTGESHTFVVRNTAGVSRTVTMVSASITHKPVPIVTTFDNGTVGYIQFNDHIATAEKQLIDAVNTLNTLNTGPVSDLILDMRYNGGGYLDLASELAYMIGNTSMLAGKTFEKIVFNDKNPSRNPVTGETLTPTPFYNKTQGFPGTTAGTALPTLNLLKLYVITGPGTCSASESVINSLRGAGIQVFLIGSTTCGKPYGFYPADNCGTTYFSIQFRGENNANFGDYTDGFSPANTTSGAGTTVAGCSVADDFTHPMGDAAEGRIAAALAFRASNNLTCPAASGGSAPPQLAKASISRDSADSELRVSKPAARQNRIIRRMR
jgi:hypothetical protein